MMSGEVIQDYFIYNGNIKSTSSDIHIIDSINEKAVYEVIKIIDGIPLYFYEHLNRMKKSLMGLNISLKKKEDEILEEIIKLVDLNKCRFVNVKLVYSFSKKEKNNFFLYFIKSEYPQDGKYKCGVHTILFPGERNNPNVKTISGSFKEKVRKIREEKDAYEALLVDEKGYITEGSRSNIFFVKENIILTPPSEKVLLGVTRNRVFEICKKLEIELREEVMKAKELENIQAAFITGTTVDVLPIFSIGNLQLASAKNEIMQSIISSYNQEMNDYIKKLRKYLRSKENV